MYFCQSTARDKGVSILGILFVVVLIVIGALIYRSATRPLEERLSATEPELSTPQKALAHYLKVREEFKRPSGFIEDVLRSMSRDDITWFQANYAYISYFALGGKTTGIAQVLSDLQRQREALKQLISDGPRSDATKILEITEKGGHAVAIAEDVVAENTVARYPIFLVKEGKNWKIRDFFGSRQQIWQTRIIGVKRKSNEALSFDEMQFEKDGIRRYLQESIEFYRSVGIAPPEDFEENVLKGSHETVAPYGDALPSVTDKREPSAETMATPALPTPTTPMLAASMTPTPTRSGQDSSAFMPRTAEEREIADTFYAYLGKKERFDRGEIHADILFAYMTSKDVAWVMKNFAPLVREISGNSPPDERWERLRQVVTVLIAQGPSTAAARVKDIKVRGARAVLLADEPVRGGESRQYNVLYIKERGLWKIKDFFFAKPLIWEKRIIESKLRQKEALDDDEKRFLAGGTERYKNEVTEFYDSVGAKALEK
jgi:hypothetical protein